MPKHLACSRPRVPLWQAHECLIAMLSWSSRSLWLGWGHHGLACRFFVASVCLRLSVWLHLWLGLWLGMWLRRRCGLWQGWLWVWLRLGRLWHWSGCWLGLTLDCIGDNLVWALTSLCGKLVMDGDGLRCGVHKLLVKHGLDVRSLSSHSAFHAHTRKQTYASLSLSPQQLLLKMLLPSNVPCLANLLRIRVPCCLLIWIWVPQGEQQAWQCEKTHPSIDRMLGYELICVNIGAKICSCAHHSPWQALNCRCCLHVLALCVGVQDYVCDNILVNQEQASKVGASSTIRWHLEKRMWARQSKIGNALPMIISPDTTADYTCGPEVWQQDLGELAHGAIQLVAVETRCGLANTSWPRGWCPTHVPP